MPLAQGGGTPSDCQARAAGYPETAQALADALDRRGLALFARIDHAGAAREAGMELADEEVFVFGGTLLVNQLHSHVTSSLEAQGLPHDKANAQASSIAQSQGGSTASIPHFVRLDFA